MYDLKIVYADGSIAAVEVTAAADSARVDVVAGVPVRSGWVLTHVACLPGTDPESLVLTLLGEDAPVGGAKGAKQAWTGKARAALGTREWEEVTSADILAEERRALGQVSDSSAGLVQLSQRLGEFLR
jgi:hypothetical protein